MFLLLDGEGNPCRGMTRRLRRGRWGCRPEGGSTFFRSERKYQRKPAARRLQRRPAPLRVAGFGLREPFGLSSASARCAHPPGKSPLLPIFERGSSQCRAQHCWTVIPYYRARSCSLFSSFKKGGPFSLRCLSPLCSPAVGGGQAYPLRDKWFPDGWLALQGQRPTSLRKDVGLCCEP